MYSYSFQLLLLSCVSQFLNAAPSTSTGNLPFELDMDSDNTGLDKGLENTENGLTAQVSKQGENFVESPKPADINPGFSFDSEPETSKTKKRPKTPSATSSFLNPTSTTDTTSVNVPSMATDAKKKRKPNGELSLLPMLNDQFFAYAWQQFIQQQILMNMLASSDFMGMDMPSNQLGLMNPMFPFGGSPFQMPTMADMQQAIDTSNMELIEDRVIDDKNGKGHIQTYKSKDGTAVVQLMTVNQSSDGIKTLPAEQTTAVPTTKSFRPRSSRATSSTKTHAPRRIRAH